MEVFDGDRRSIGRVTSGSFAPSLKRAVAMAYIRANEPADPGTWLLVGKPGMFIESVIVDLPFYSEGTVRAGL